MFKIGDYVSFGILGPCQITGLETKKVGEEEIQFFQIRAVRTQNSKKTLVKNAPNILVPLKNATSSGLRAPMTKEESEAVLDMLSSGEYFFPLQEIWTSKQKKLEEAIRKEGIVGLTKAIGHLFILRRQDAVPQTEVSRFFDKLLKLLCLEFAESLLISQKEAELLLLKALKAKARADH